MLASFLAAAWPRARAAADPDPVRTEAAERFDRAIRLVNEGDMAGGLAEFQRAYALIPSPVVLYNLGLVHAELHRPVEAVRELTQALARSEALKPEYVERAKAVLQVQSQNIGRVELSTNVKAGSVEVDNVEVAQLPLARPLEVAVGTHVVGVVSPGYAPARKEVTVAGKQQAAADLQLVPIEGLLAPTPETRAQYVATASSHRAWSWVTLGVGLAVAGGGIALAVASQSQLPAARSALAQANYEWERYQGRQCDFSTALTPAQQTACENLLNDAMAKVDETVRWRNAGWVMTGVGGAVAVTGVVLLATGADPHRYDQEPAEPLLGGWRLLPEVGAGRVLFAAARAF